MFSIISIIIITFLSVALCILAGIYKKFFRDNLETKSSNNEVRESNLVTPFTVSVAEYISKFELPAIVFNCQGKELLFILDTGSNGCHINRSVLKDLDVKTTMVEKKEGVESFVATGNGVSAPAAEKCTLVLSLGEYTFNVLMNVEELDAAFDYIFKTDGVRVHGILGTNFLRTNNWTIDFANNIAYPAFRVKNEAE